MTREISLSERSKQSLWVKRIDALSTKQDEVTATLHPVFNSRIQKMADALREMGYDVVLTEGWRSTEAQEGLLKSGASSVSISFHNVTDPKTGKKSSLAVHILSKDAGPVPHARMKKFSRKKFNEELGKVNKFWHDLHTVGKRFGVHTGLYWKKPWDPAHCQPYDVLDKRALRRTKKWSEGKRSKLPQFMNPEPIPGPTSTVASLNSVMYSANPQDYRTSHESDMPNISGTSMLSLWDRLDHGMGQTPDANPSKPSLLERLGWVNETHQTVGSGSSDPSFIRFGDDPQWHTFTKGGLENAYEYVERNPGEFFNSAESGIGKFDFGRQNEMSSGTKE